MPKFKKIPKCSWTSKNVYLNLWELAELKDTYQECETVEWLRWVMNTLKGSS